MKQGHCRVHKYGKGEADTVDAWEVRNTLKVLNEKLSKPGVRKEVSERRRLEPRIPSEK